MAELCEACGVRETGDKRVENGEQKIESTFRYTLLINEYLRFEM